MGDLRLVKDYFFGFLGVSTNHFVMKKFMIWIGYFFLGILVVIVLYLGTDFLLSRMSSRSSKKPQHTDQTIAVYLLSNGVHTDIVLPIRHKLMDWTQVFPVENTVGVRRDHNWVAIGWGDKGFYLNTPEWKDLSAKTALIAALGVGETALHVTYYNQLNIGQYCRLTHINASQYQLLIDYIVNSLQKDDDNKPLLITTDAQYGSDDAFYEAEGAYNLFFSCNTWTNKALKHAQMPAGVWTVRSSGVLWHYP